MSVRHKKNSLQNVYAITAICIWSTSAALIKSLLNSIPNFQVLAISSLCASVFLLIINMFSGDIRELIRCTYKDYFFMAILGFLGLFLYYGFYYYGLSQLSSQEACILNYLWPIMLVLFSYVILKERVTTKKIAAMALSFLGVVVLTMGSKDAVNGNRLLGIISCVLGAVCYSVFSVLNKKRNMNQNITMMVAWSITAVCAFVSGCLFEKWVIIQGVQWMGIAWIGVGINALAYLLWALALKDAGDSAMIANLAFLTPFLSIVISAVFLKEEIGIQAIAALVLIVSGILLQNIKVKGKNSVSHRN